MVAKKKVEEEEDEEFEEEYDDEEEEFEESTFKCRVCNKDVPVDAGDDIILLCDDCAENFDLDKIWDDFDAEKIPEEKLKTFDLTPYKLNKAPKKGSKK